MPNDSYHARAVVFDFDGVIADTEWLHCDTFCAVLAEEGIVLSDEDHTERFLGINDFAGFRKAFDEVGRSLPESDLRSLVERKSSIYSARLDEIRPFPRLGELVEALAGRCLLGIASGGRATEIRAVLRRNGLDRHFPVVVSADDVPLSKPDPAPYLRAVEVLRARTPSGRLSPTDCVAIEDSILGVRSAKSAGLRCLAVTHTYPRERLREADLVIDSIASASPDLILARPDR